MMTITRIVAGILVLYTLSVPPAALSQRQWSVEAGGGISLRGAIGTMLPIPGIPSPSPLSFVSDEQFAPAFGYMGADIRLREDISIGLRLGVGGIRGGWTALERIPIAQADSVYQATIEHRLTADVTALNAEPFLRWHATDRLGIDVGIPVMAMLSSTHRQTQRFADPVGLPFSDGSTQQITSTGTVPDLRTLVPSVRGRLSYALPLFGGSWTLVPHAAVAITPFSLHGGTTWRDVTVDLGIAIRFGSTISSVDTTRQRVPRTDTLYVRDTITVLQPGMPNPDAELIDRSVGQMVTVNDTLRTVTVTERYRKILPKPPGILEATIRTVFVDEGGRERTDATIVTKRRRNVVSVAQLPIIVFEGVDTTLPERLIRLSPEQAIAFHERDLIDTSASSTVPHWSRHVLNIVGRRMRRAPRSTVVLRTAGNEAIAEARVTSVRAYLKDAFGVESRRLKHDHGRTGDTSVMIVVDPSCDIVAPVVRADTTLEADLPTVKIYPDVVADAAISAWSIDVVQAGKVVHTDYGTGAVPQSIAWRMHQSVSAERALQETFEVRLTVADMEGGRVVTDPARILLREAAIMDASAAVQTSGLWLAHASTPYRPCPQQIPNSGVTRVDVVTDDASTAWWMRGIDPQDRRYWNGTWTMYQSSR